MNWLGKLKLKIEIAPEDNKGLVNCLEILCVKILSLLIFTVQIPLCEGRVRELRGK